MKLDNAQLNAVHIHPTLDIEQVKCGWHPSSGRPAHFSSFQDGICELRKVPAHFSSFQDGICELRKVPAHFSSFQDGICELRKVPAHFSSFQDGICELRKVPNALYPISQKLPEHCLSNSFV